MGRDKVTLLNADQRPPKRKAFKGWQQRVFDEKKALDKKLLKLNMFLESEDVKALSTKDVKLLGEQAELMKKYSNILQKRIEQF